MSLDEWEDGGRELPTGAAVVYAVAAVVLVSVAALICLLT